MDSTEEGKAAGIVLKEHEAARRARLQGLKEKDQVALRALVEHAEHLGRGFAVFNASVEKHLAIGEVRSRSVDLIRKADTGGAAHARLSGSVAAAMLAHLA